MTHNDKKGPYIIWSWFMVHMCKRIISPGVFYIFYVNSRVKEQKMALNDKKISVALHIWVTKPISLDRVFCCTR